MQEFSGYTTEILIVDNNPEDISSEELHEKLKKYSAERICCYINEKNIGSLPNLNRCIELAKGKWVSMLMDDDVLASDYAQKMCCVLAKYGDEDSTFIIRGGMDYLRNNEIIQRKSLLSRWFYKHNDKGVIKYDARFLDYMGPCYVGMIGQPTCGTIINRNLFIKHGGYDTDHAGMEDAIYPDRMVSIHDYNVYVSTGIMGYCRVEDSASYSKQVFYSWANDYVDYEKFFCKRSKSAASVYKKYSNEMREVFLQEIVKHISDSSYGNDEKQKYIEDINSIMKNHHSKLKLSVFRKTRILAMRRKQIKALMMSLA